MRHRVDPDGLRLPVKLDSTSNGEFVPIPLSGVNRTAIQLARASATASARRKGVSRRDFLVSACGAAATLLAFNEANAAAGKAGGFFDLHREAALDESLARDVLDGNEFIFDVQGHFVEPNGAWLKSLPSGARPLTFAPKTQCLGDAARGNLDYLACLGPDQFVKDVFLDSDTDMMVLSFVPSRPDAEPLTIAVADAVRRIVDRMEGSHRLLVHGRVNPNQPGDIERMDELAAKWKVCAWKTYTQWGPDGRGYFLSDEPGLRFIEKARALGIKVICVHKGVPFGRKSYEHSQCHDIGVVARQFPDVSFIVYHSGFVPGRPEEAYGASGDMDGVDTLIRSLHDNGIAPNSNVYAELGTTWRFAMREPDSAAHLLGKLLVHVGEHNVLWGTDSLWYGSPQDQIQAFRAFQISQEFRERFGYPALTPGIRAGVFGLNATRPYRVDASAVRTTLRADTLSRERASYGERPEPSFLTYGPRTRREFLNLLRWNGGSRA
ncbi:MAG: amidohydrolase family protein [Betaproteobacteria bacterium]|nr:amidohydrolase family protein [Betaproteobacteria bacterium]